MLKDTSEIMEFVLWLQPAKLNARSTNILLNVELGVNQRVIDPIQINSYAQRYVAKDAFVIQGSSETSKDNVLYLENARAVKMNRSTSVELSPLVKQPAKIHQCLESFVQMFALRAASVMKVS